jgi:hypothetical protein
VTVVEAVNTVGWHAPPLIICAGRCILRGWFDDTDIPAGISIGVSESGYIDYQLAYTWIQIFWRDTKNVRKGKYQLVICDGFGSHCTREFVKFYEDHDIILFFLPPHTAISCSRLMLVFFMHLNTTIRNLWLMLHTRDAPTLIKLNLSESR